MGFTRWEGWGLVKALLNGHALDLQGYFFKTTMITNGEASMKENFRVNLVFQLWVKLSSYPIFKHKLLEFIKLAKTLCVQVFKFVEDEDCFLVVAFVKTKSRGIASSHLDLCIQFYAQCFYMIETIPFEEAINQCKDTKACSCIQC
jgi:hypothetical protein